MTYNTLFTWAIDNKEQIRSSKLGDTNIIVQDLINNLDDISNEGDQYYPDVYTEQSVDFNHTFQDLMGAIIKSEKLPKGELLNLRVRFRLACMEILTRHYKNNINWLDPNTVKMLRDQISGRDLNFSNESDRQAYMEEHSKKWGTPISSYLLFNRGSLFCFADPYFDDDLVLDELLIQKGVDPLDVALGGDDEGDYLEMGYDFLLEIPEFIQEFGLDTKIWEQVIKGISEYEELQRLHDLYYIL